VPDGDADIDDTNLELVGETELDDPSITLTPHQAKGFDEANFYPSGAFLEGGDQPHFDLRR
jgi:hypothetical protein